MSEPKVRTSIDIPAPLHRRLREAAARKGCSARQLILESLERVVADEEPPNPKRRLVIQGPLVPSRGPGAPTDWTNEKLYELLDFP